MKVKTEFHDGLEFQVPTWDPTPVEHNPAGSWAKDPELEERLRAEIVAAIPNIPELLAEARTAPGQSFGSRDWCKTYWGSHGCDREPDHPGLCVCSISNEDGEFDCCSMILKYGDSNTAILWWNNEDLPSVHYWTWFR